MFSLKKYQLFLTVLSIMMLYSKNISQDLEKENQDDDKCVPYSEIIKIKQVDITHKGLKSIIRDFVEEVKIFEHGVNSWSSYKIDYYVWVGGICRNDSSFIYLKSKSGGIFFYGFKDFISERTIEKFRMTQIDGRNVLIEKNIEKYFCNKDKKNTFYKSLNKKGDFKLNSHKYKGEKNHILSGYFEKYYLLEQGVLKKFELRFDRHEMIFNGNGETFEE